MALGKRKYPRIPLAIDIQSERGAKPLTFVSRNVSAGGIFIDGSQVFPLGDVLSLHCKLPYAHGELKVKGKVVRHQQDEDTGVVNGMAIEFVELDTTHRDILSSYIQNTMETKKSPT